MDKIRTTDWSNTNYNIWVSDFPKKSIRPPVILNYMWVCAVLKYSEKKTVSIYKVVQDQ